MTETPSFQAAKPADRPHQLAMPLNPKRTIAELKELRALTGDDNGAQRVAFTLMWCKPARG